MTDIARQYYEANMPQNNASEIYLQNIGVKQYGYSHIVNGISYGLVKYFPSQIAVWSIDNGTAGLSASFSGCYMAKFRYQGQYYIAHIAKEHSHTASSESWNRLVDDRIIQDVILFKPTEGLNVAQAVGVWGLITSDNRCYRLYANENTQIANYRRTFDSIPIGYPTLTPLNRICSGKIPLGTTRRCLIL